MRFKNIFPVLLTALIIDQALNAQCITGNCVNGLGEKRYPDSSRFTGRFENGAKKEGVYFYPNGDVYSGSFLNNQRSGHAVYQYRNGELFTGEYEDDQKRFGTLQYRNGDKYTGSWDDNQPDGYGTKLYATGKKWEGVWDNGRPDWGFLMDSARTSVESGSLTETVSGSKSVMKQANSPRIFAVLVGISDYEGTVNDLNYSDDDARLFYNYLVKAMPKESAAGEIRVLLNGDATRQKIKDAMESVFAKSTENDFIIFFFSGHGAPGYFCPADLNDHQLEHNLVKTTFKNAKAAYRLCIADACYSGTMGVEADNNASLDAANRLRDARIAVIMSSRPGQTSQEVGRLKHSLFSHYLVKGINGSADLNHDKYVTAGELFLYTRAKVDEDSNGDQVPVIFGKNLDKIPLSHIH